MASMSTVHAQVESDIEERASEALEREGLTIADAVREMLGRVARDGSLPFLTSADEAAIFGDNDPAYDAWFRAKVQEALDDTQPGLSEEEAEQYMSSRRQAALARLHEV